MVMDKKEIEYIANLSRIELTEAEKEVFIHQLSSILSYIEKLNTLDTENIKPLAHTMNVSNVFRDDKPESSISREDAFINAPAKIDAFFKVPKVIE